MQLEDFNAAPASDAAELVRACADVERWVDAVVAGRPYESVGAAVAACQDVAQPWSEEEIDAALARHPRIGQRAEGADTDAAMSRREQASVTSASDEVATALAEGNRDYEARFGHVFLIRAAGRSPEEMLAQLRERLENTPEQERQNAARNLREIAALRLEGMLSA